MNDKAQMRTWLKEKMKSFEQDLSALVALNSYTQNKEGGDQVASYLQSLFEGLPLFCERHPSDKYADHLVFSTSFSENKAPLLLLGHTDTVFPPGTFEGYKRDGDLARGPGVLDMKGGVLVVLYALKYLSEQGVLPNLPMHFILVSDEEIGSPEGKKIIETYSRNAQSALVFESGREGDQIVTARKGVGLMKAYAYGKSAHAGNNHQDGKNAIWAMAKWIDELQKLTDYKKGISVNVGKIHGGQSQNTVPDYVEAELDLRFVSKKDALELEEKVRELAAKSSEWVSGTRIELSGGVVRLPMERTNQSAALATQYGRHAVEAGLAYSEASLVGGGSDANTTSALGIASIDALGPRGKGFHTKDEQIEFLSLMPKIEALTSLLAEIAHQ